MAATTLSPLDGREKNPSRGLGFIGMIVLVHLIFFLLACHYQRIYMGDSFEYIYEALNIKNHFFFYSGNPAMPVVPEYMTQRQPLYPLFLLVVYLFSINNWIVLFLQNILSICNIWYARKVLIKIGYKPGYDSLLFLLIITYPAQFINASTIAPDILLQTFTLLYLGSFISLVKTNRPRYALWMSLALAAGMFVKPVLYPFTVFHLLFLLIVLQRHKLLSLRMILVALLPLILVLAYSGWNYGRTGKFHFTSNQAFNASYYYYPFISRQQGIDSANRYLAKERDTEAKITSYKERYDYANNRGAELLRQNFFPYMTFHLRNTARIFIEPGKGEIDLFTGELSYGRLYRKEQTGFYATWRQKGWAGMGAYIAANPSLPLVLLVFLFNCLRLAGLLIFFFNRRIHWGLRFFIFTLIAFFALAAGPIANTRYFLPVSLMVAGCSVIGFTGRRTVSLPKQP
jgi:hypothetical protein